VRIVNHFRSMEIGLGGALRLGRVAEKIIGAGGMRALTHWLKNFAGDNMSEWMSDTPFAATGVPATQKEGAEAVYFPACISRIMGRLPNEPKITYASHCGVVSARRHARVHSIRCCRNMLWHAFSSKGFNRAHDIAANAAVEKFWRWSGEGKLPVVIDTSPCSYTLKTSRPSMTPENQKRFDRLRLLDSIEFVHDQLLPGLTVWTQLDSVALLPVCSVTKMGLTAKLEGIAKACSPDVSIPPDAGCCAFAGDRGFLFPELTKSATKLEAAEVREKHPDGCYFSSRTCEIGMTRVTGDV